jgi:hypothetical protein
MTISPVPADHGHRPHCRHFADRNLALFSAPIPAAANLGGQRWNMFVYNFEMSACGG